MNAVKINVCTVLYCYVFFFSIICIWDNDSISCGHTKLQSHKIAHFVP